MKKKSNSEGFRAEPDVQQILKILMADAAGAPNKSKIINEAIRLNGQQAAVTVLEREVEIARLKLAAIVRHQADRNFAAPLIKGVTVARARLAQLEQPKAKSP